MVFRQVSAKLRLIINLLLVLILFSGLAGAQPKKYQVITPRITLHLEPNEKSPVVANVLRGEILTQASAVRFRHHWIFVYYYSAEKGKTLAGYAQERFLRKLFPEVNSVLISNGNGDFQYTELDFSQDFKFPFSWGISKEKVIETEGKPQYQEKSEQTEILRYQKEIMSRTCLVEYIFWQNELTSARFYLLNDYPDRNQYINDFMKAKDYLGSRYGQPIKEQVVWLDSTYKEKRDFWGKALGAGLLEFRASWMLKRTEVEIILTGSDNRVAFLAECTGQQYKSLVSN